MRGATKRISENNIRPRIHKALMKRFDLFWRIDIPKLWCVTGHEAHLKEICTRCTIGQKNAFFSNELREFAVRWGDAISGEAITIIS